MYNFGIDVVMQVCVGGQIFVEVSYLVVVVEFNYVFFDYFFESGVGFWISEIDNVVVKFVKFYQIVIVRGIFCQIVVLCCFFVEIFIVGNIWVDIGQELYVFLILLFNV